MGNLFTCTTNGKGLWTRAKKTVPIIRLELDIVDWDGDIYGELRAYFKITSWNTKTDGLIYTDHQWITELCDHLVEKGFTANAVADIDYSEQGMQSIDYVSMDVGETFIKECDELYRFTIGKNQLDDMIKITHGSVYF